MHHRALPGFLLLALAASSTAAVAQERRYDVEIVVFEHTDTSAGEQERWRPEVHVPEFHEVIEFVGGSRDFVFLTDADRIANEGEPVETPEGYRRLPTERLQLGGMVGKLEESDRYRVLRHLAWRQPSDDRERAIPIRVRAGAPMTVRVPVRDFEELYEMEEEGVDFGSDTGMEADDEPVADVGTGGAQTFAGGPWQRTRLRPLMKPVEVRPLDGTVRVAVSRYLHVTTDLHLTTPVEWTALPGRKSGADAATEEDEAVVDPASTGGIDSRQHAIGPDGRTMLSYPFRQSRRMRSGELHYLDHPVLGLLIRVERAPEEEEEG